MDVSNMIGGNNVTIDVVKKSPTRKGVILSPGGMKIIEGKEKICFLVEMDGKQLGYLPNKTSLKSMAGSLGNETQAWIGKVVFFEIGIINMKEAIVAKVV